MADLMSPALSRAIRIAHVHPSVRAARVVEDAVSGAILLDLDIEQQLPSAWRAAGESPSGVRAIETARIVLPLEYPTRSPRTFLRSDFDRRHPHLLPVPSNQPPQPCVVNGFPSELIQARGFEGYLDQLVDWLDKAAMLELNSERHGWEPVRRDHLDDELIVESKRLREMCNGTGDCSVVSTDFVKIELDDGQRLIRIALNLEECVELAAAACSQKKVDDHVSRGRSIALVVGAPDAEGGPTIIDTTVPESVSSVEDLLERAGHYGCRDAIRSKLDYIGLLVAQGTIAPTPLVIVFLVRRPFRITGSDSPIEICSYVLDLQPGEGLLHQNGEVRLCGLREEISTSLLMRASGDAATAPQRPWMLLGCGSVGSKIAVHLARRGLGPSKVIDRALMSPHNYARHSLMPESRARGGLITFKTDALARALLGFQSTIGVEREDVVELVATDAGRKGLGDAELFLNTTGSSVVREALVSQQWENRPVFGEAHLLGAGAVAYAAFEGAGGNPSLSDLAAESYRLIASDPAIRGKVFGATAEAVEIGQGCGTLTFPMPDTRLSTFAAGLSEVVTRRLRDNEHTPPTGQIHMGQMLPDGLSQSWRSVEVDPWIVVDLGGRYVHVSARVDTMIRRAIAARPGVETGGVIVGRYLQMSETFQVVDLIEAPPDSIFTAARFTLGIEGLRPAIARLTREAGGSLYVLGTWHNHLEPSGPSLLDAATAAHLALRQFYPVLMLIAHAEGYSGLITEVRGVSDGTPPMPPREQP